MTAKSSANLCPAETEVKKNAMENVFLPSECSIQCTVHCTVLYTLLRW